MSQIFPQWTNKLPAALLAATILLVVGGVGFLWYYGSPKYTDVGYRPTQPVPFSHKLHAGDLGMDCRYCHSNIERSAVANVPATQTCMNCHTLVLPQSEKLLAVRESWATGKPIEWVNVHLLPQYAYFNHSLHLNAGIGCISCHGNIAEMEKVQQMQPLSMSWCLDCHRNPDPHLRPVDQITNMNYAPPADQEAFAERVKEEKKLNPTQDCSGCHR
ncbi:MAG: cytochrome c3 family protein [bacterium]|nr:cytochrome c3 family protein [bacterium]